MITQKFSLKKITIYFQILYFILLSAVDFFKQGLELIPKDTWATHALAHVMEMEGRQDEGIEFMNQTVENWKVHFTSIIFNCLCLCDQPSQNVL